MKLLPDRDLTIPFLLLGIFVGLALATLILV